VYPASASDRQVNSQTSSVSDVVVEPYNTVFSLNALINSSHMTTIIENNSLYRICQNQLKVNTPSFADINYLISQSMSSSTATMRFPGSNNSDIRKICTNLIPFPRIHFIS